MSLPWKPDAIAFVALWLLLQNQFPASVVCLPSDRGWWWSFSPPFPNPCLFFPRFFVFGFIKIGSFRNSWPLSTPLLFKLLLVINAFLHDGWVRSYPHIHCTYPSIPWKVFHSLWACNAIDTAEPTNKWRLSREAGHRNAALAKRSSFLYVFGNRSVGRFHRHFHKYQMRAILFGVWPARAITRYTAPRTFSAIEAPDGFGVCGSMSIVSEP